MQKKYKHPTCPPNHCRRPIVKKKPVFRKIRQKPIRKVSKKHASKVLQDQKVTKKDWELYNLIWEERPHMDFETGGAIFGEALTIYFHHILEKRNYPQYRHKLWNIVLVVWNTHGRADNLSDLVPKIKAYRQELLAWHESGSPETEEMLKFC